VITTVRPVILSGGAGTRLWPLSTESSPKQFLSIRGEPLFEATLKRLRGLESVGPPTVVTGIDHLEAVERAVESASAELASIIIEPVGRNTGPAVVAAALVSDPGEVLVVLPSDHTIADAAAFRSVVKTAVSLASEGALVTFGAEPLRPETGYGYIEKGEPIEGGFRVARFKEKPDHDEAERLVAAKTHLWNSGMFVFTAGRLLEEARLHSPELVTGVVAALPGERSGRIFLDPSFATVTPISLDHAVMEKTDAAVVIPVAVGWSDIGSWQSLWEQSDHDDSGNTLIGDVTVIDVTNSYIHSSSRKVAVAGVDGLVVVETPEALLVVPSSSSQMVRDLVKPLDADRPPD
jgi:mannose-1-phosphate guanylyltransferase/mannose-6-phosphate isomerase